MTNKLNELSKRVDAAIISHQKVSCEVTALEWFNDYAGNALGNDVDNALKLAQALIKDLQNGSVIAPVRFTEDMHEAWTMEQVKTNLRPNCWKAAIKERPQSNVQKVLEEIEG